MKTNIIDYFLSIPDEVLVKMASDEWEQLELLCYAITLDLITKDKAVVN